MDKTLPNAVEIKNKVLMVIVDGYGFDPVKEKAILANIPDGHPDREKLIREEAARQHYAIWAADSPFMFSLRQEFPTVTTKTSGLEVGYEKLEPEVQGNSETGHQQLGNLCVAMQPPLKITLSIESGEFFQNELLRECLTKVTTTGANLNACILLSGEKGDDGRVHSCWNHLEAFLEMCFTHFHLAPARLRLQAILDGRDSPARSSVEDRNFLGKLADLLGRYNAKDSLAWVIGRSRGMDRDYDEVKARTDYNLLTKGEGEKVNGIDGAIEKVKELHRQGYTDTDVTPIAVCDKNGDVRRISDGDVFVDLNFRADRQRAKIASLLGAKPFLEREAGLKGAKWKLDWIDDNLKLDVYCLTEYHPELSSKYGAKVLFQTSAHEHNLLTITSKASQELGFRFKYLLLAESTKALHVGYFIRGRREKPEVPDCEERIIVPSYSHSAGVERDDDYYKTPQMKAFEIMGVLMDEMYRCQHDLIIVNFSNPDMLGHLICKHFDEVVKSIEVIDSVIKILVPYAQKLGFHFILTSDHGNADDYSPAHGAHDVLTTFISPRKDLVLRGDLKGKARLFDIPWCILDILGLTGAVANFIPEFPPILKSRNLIGRSLITTKGA